MYRSKKKRNIVIFSLIGILFCMGIGYAAFNTELKISGTSKVTSNWDIEITNVTPGTPTGSAENTVAPKWDALTASMEADLYEKGDAMEYDVTIENKGTIDAKLNNILTNLENSNSEAVNITFTGYTKGEILKSKSIKIIHVKIEYNPNYEGEETSSEVEINFDYGQNNDETSPPENTHLITYDCITNGGNDCSSNNEYLVTGTPVDLTKTGTKDNYDFAGWNTDKDSKEVLTELTVGDTDITLYAIFKAKDTTPPIIDNISTSTTSNSITVVVAAHDDESGISKYEFSINDGNYIDNGNNNVYTFTNLKSDTNYNIKVRVTNGTELTAEDQVGSGIDITDDVTTTGDGLYEDAYEEGRYVYRGQNPNNYIMFNDELWRIIAKETDGTYKIIRNDVLADRAFDNQNRTASSTYCADTSSCGVYAAVDGTFSSPSGSQSGTVTEDSSIKIYLNDDYYVNNINETAKGQMTSHPFNIGAVEYLNESEAEADSIEKNIAGEKMYQWTGNVGLANVSDILRASTNPLCTSATTSYNGTNECNSNYLLDKGASTLYYWTINASSYESGGRSHYAWYGSASGSYARVRHARALYSTVAPRPVVFLKSDTTLSGSGTSDDPFKILNGVSLPELEKPTFSESGTLPKTVTITYPEGCGSTLTCTYQKDNGEEMEVTSKTVDIEFTNNGTLLAKASDGTNEVSSSYNVKVGIDITDDITTTGDGLYEDTYEDGRYVYKGANPNNYVEFNDELWRIISKEKDGSIKITRNEILTNKAWDTSNSNNWARPATLNTYLNGDYYASLTSAAKSQIASHNFGIGEVVWNNTNLGTQISDENGTIWNGKIGLINISDYIRSNTNTSKCGNFSLINTNYSTCKSTSWLFTGKQYWTFSPASNGTSSRNIQASGQINSNSVNVIDNYRPSLYLKSNIKIIGGEGTSNNPYQLEDYSKYIPTFSESGTNPKTVNINYPEGCGSTLTCTYQKDNEKIVNVTNQTVAVEFTTNGSVVATVTKGTDTFSSSYSVKIGTISEDLKELVVSEGDGLYEDTYEEGKYTYKGANPNNYITFNNEMWRIISIGADNTIKIIRNESIGNQIWDATNSNAWKLSDIKTYLNDTYLPTITTNADKIVPHTWSIGRVTYGNSDLAGQIISENGKQSQATSIGMITASEYLRANTNTEQCGNYSLNNTNNTTCLTTNWMYNIVPQENYLWTISPDASTSYLVFYVSGDTSSAGRLSNEYVSLYLSVSPTLYLTSDTILTGDGSSGNPYVITN